MRVGEVGLFNGGKVIKLAKNKYAYPAGKYMDELYGRKVKTSKEKPYTVVSAQRYDINSSADYKFYIAKKGGNIIIAAGCRYFINVKDAKAHWNKPVKLSVFSGDFRVEDRKYKNEQSIKIIDDLLAKLKKKGV